MPEYLFKAKAKDNGEWFFGLLCYNIYKMLCIQPTDGGEPSDFIRVIIPETICQYTGKNDRKGTKIFNSDRIRFFDEEGTSDYIIKWDDYDCRYIVEDGNGCTDGLDGFIAANCEVIDNLHDLPKDARKEGESE